MKMKKIMKLRAHHLLCIPRFKGGGYSKEFCRHLRNICQLIRDNPNSKIVVLKDCDIVCVKCPHFDKKNNICIKRPGINKHILIHDQKVLDGLKIKKDSFHKIKDVFNLSVKEIDSRKIRKICKGCEYLGYCIRYGVNKSFLKDINR